jgi:hypothetical protein
VRGRIVRDGVARLSMAAVAVPNEWVKRLTDWVVTRFEKADRGD